VREVVREMTAKAGQKCTAIRRILVPQGRAQAAIDAITTSLKMQVVGDPANALTSMGPVVNMTQRKSVEERIAKLKTQADVAYAPENFQPHEAELERGAFVPPTLLRVRDSSNADVIHEVEVFGPVATIVPYRDKQDAFALARRGGGSLAASVYSGDTAFLAEAGVALGTTHGRVMLIDPAVGDSHTGHGIVLPSCLHGGPGRAGGGEELGGLHGLWFYHQRVAMQGSGTTLSELAARAADPAE
jgi:3,4-dehydroadipyl-CoA semialdehyde dehydrogenase